MNKWRWDIKLRGYHSWKLIRQRCRNPVATGYDSYGAKGIDVCDRWYHSYDNFMDDMGVAPEGTTIDRIDNSKGYEPGNCRWATHIEQLNNRPSFNRPIEHEGEVKNLAEWAAEIGVSESTLRARLDNGMSTQRAFTSEKLWPKRKHGTDKMYSKYKCRCHLCKAFNTEKGRRYRQKKQGFDL